MNVRPGFIGSVVLWLIVSFWIAGAHSQVAPSAEERAGYGGLLAAATRGHADAIRALAANGADLDVWDAYGRTPLHVAAYGAHHAAMRALIDAGAPLDHVNNLGWTAVIEAIVLGDGGPRHVETLDTLIRAGANLQLADRNGRTPLELARLHGHDTMVQMLIRAGAQ